PSRDVHVPMHHVLPDGLHGLHIVRIARNGGDVRSAAVKVHRPHGVADDLTLLFDGRVVLTAFRTPLSFVPDLTLAVALPSLVEIPLREFYVSLVTRHVIELHEGKLDFFVTGYPMAIRHTKGLVQVIRVSNRHVQELAFTGGLIVGDS